MKSSRENPISSESAGRNVYGHQSNPSNADLNKENSAEKNGTKTGKTREKNYDESAEIGKIQSRKFKNQSSIIF